MMDSFVLRRVGKCSGGTNGTLNLSSLVTRIGRHTINDFCMDSTEFPCLISRFHSAIMREVTGGIAKYYVYDCKSVNGTFLNNIKIPPEKNIALREGDVITFGCCGGNAVQVGGKATEEYSEFQYMFTRHREAVSSRESAGISPKSSHVTLSKAIPNGVIKTDNSTVQSLVTSSFVGDAHQTTARQLNKDQVSSANGVHRDNIASQPAKVQTLPLKNALNNSTGHLTLPSEQKTPNAGSQKRKLNANSTGRSVTSRSSENGSAAKKQKVSNSKGQAKAKAQKTKKKTRKSSSYSDDELCSAFDCQKPSSETLSWVQCDDCDEWFHVDCVRTIKGNYDIEELEEAEFHCGCV